MPKPHTGELIFFWILFGAIALLTFAVMSPYIVPLFLAAVFTILFSPIHRRVLAKVKGNETEAAFFTVAIVLCLVLVPLIFLGILMFQEVLSIYGSFTQENGGFALIDRVADIAERHVQNFVPSFEIHANTYVYIEGALRWVAANLNSFFSGIVLFLFQTFIVVVAMFFFYRDGDKLRAFAVKWSPLADSYDESIIAKVELAVSSVVKGALTTAMAQGFLVGFGFAIFGVPNPVLWGVVATIAALIPMVGTALVTMPAAVWLLFTGPLWAGIGLIIWAIVCVGLADNVLNPYLVKRRGVDIHPFLILLSVFGGLAYFGPVGFLAGPIVLAFFFTLLDVYPQIVRGVTINGTKPE